MERGLDVHSRHFKEGALLCRASSSDSTASLRTMFILDDSAPHDLRPIPILTADAGSSLSFTVCNKVESKGVVDGSVAHQT